MSNASRGAYFKQRTKKWLIERGWQVANLEEVRFVYRPGQPPMPVKRDQFASDLLAMTATRLVLVQVKGGEMARGGTFPAARRAFAEFQIPLFVEQWIVAWPPRAREPRIVQVCGDSYIEVKETAHGKARQDTTEGEDSAIADASGDAAGS